MLFRIISRSCQYIFIMILREININKHLPFYSSTFDNYKAIAMLLFLETFSKIK